MKKLLERWEKWNKLGMRWPLPHDPITEKPSITIMFAYASFVLAFISIIIFHFYPTVMFLPAATAISFWALSTVFYLLRKLTKAKFDWQNKSLELGSEDSEQKPTNEDSIGN